ncbi:MAG: cytochrome c [Chloroflexota bacterium]|nr:cytochrome c [Anaerolineae bacterium]
MKHPSLSSSLFVIVSLMLALILAACGGGGASATAIPTSTIIPTYRLLTRTPVAAIETAVATQAAESASAEANAGLDPEVVARGKARYDALACASCHGEGGVGTDKGPSLITNTLSDGDFIAFMRSGGKLGAAHQYATNKLSITGGEALYQYLLSLRK